MVNIIPGLSYGTLTGGSLAYPHRRRSKLVWNNKLLATMLELIHPGNLGPLPPNPSVIAYKASQMGVAQYKEFLITVWY